MTYFFLSLQTSQRSGKQAGDSDRVWRPSFNGTNQRYSQLFHLPFCFIFWHLMIDMNWWRFECRCPELLLFQMVRCSCGGRTLMVSWVWGKIIPALRLLNMFRVWVGSRWLRSALEETTALCCLSLESCLDGERTLLDSWASETLQVWLVLHVKAKSVTVWQYT